MINIFIFSKKEVNGLVSVNSGVKKYVSRIRDILETPDNYKDHLEQILVYLDIIDNYLGSADEIFEDKEIKVEDTL